MNAANISPENRRLITRFAELKIKVDAFPPSSIGVMGLENELIDIGYQLFCSAEAVTDAMLLDEIELQKSHKSSLKKNI